MALQDPDVINELTLSKEQQERLQVISAEWKSRREETVYSVNINTIYAHVVAPDNLRPDERQKAMQALAEQNRVKFNEVLTKEQQEKLATLKGKEFDVRLLRQ